MQKYKIRKITIKEAIRKATVLKGKKFGNIFNEQFDTIVYCIVDTVRVGSRCCSKSKDESIVHIKSKE